MYQTPTAIWNEIAATQTLQHPRWKRLFRLDAEAMLTALAALEAELEADGADARVIRSYLLTAPLLMETVAISQYLQANGLSNLRSSLPELTSIHEAVVLATEEFQLNPTQQATLRRLLEQAYPKN